MLDNMACFLDENNIALNWTEDKNDLQYKRSQKAYKILNNEGFIVHKIHQPDPLYTTKEEATGWEASKDGFDRKAGERLAASYINFYMVNEAIILPQFNSSYDKKAVAFLESFYPDKEIVPIYSREILLGGGNIHCITQQVPKPI